MAVESLMEVCATAVSAVPGVQYEMVAKTTDYISRVRFSGRQYW
jgi:hypothetical protein